MDIHPNDLHAALPNHIQGLAPSQIGLVADRGRTDPTVVKLWIGEGDLPTPPFVVEAAHRAMLAGETRYTYSRGVPRLHEALVDYHRRHWGVDVATTRFNVTAGGMNAIMQACQALLSPGDEVLIPSPTWPNGAEAIRVCGGTPVFVPYRQADGRFTLALDDVIAAINPRTRAIIINSPSNPTGWTMPMSEMEALRDACRARDLWIISDEVYAHFTYGPPGLHNTRRNDAIAPSFLQVCTPDDRLIVTNTFSKNWAMTGWRAGWMVFPEGMADVFNKLNQYNTTSIPTFVQHAAVTALDEGDGFIRTMVGRCAESRDIMIDGLRRIPGVTVMPPDGAFYLMARIEDPAHPGETSLDLAYRLLQDAKVGVAPGTAFGPDGAGMVRICFAVSPDLAREAVARLTAALSPLQSRHCEAPLGAVAIQDRNTGA